MAQGAFLLFQVLIDVAVGEGAPIGGRERAEGGVGLEGLGGAFGGELVDGGVERDEAGLEIAVFGDHELWRGGSAFGPGEDVDVVYRFSLG